MTTLEAAPHNATMETSRKWTIGWVIAFVGFPLGGLLVTLLIGRIETTLQGMLGGLLAGAVIGVTQMLALRRRLSVGYEWIIATAAAMGVGVGLSLALFGTETTPNAILLRAPLTGLLIGIAQWTLLRKQVPHALWWVPAVTLVYGIAWFITAQVIGAFVDQGFVVFGSSGAVVYQLLTGLTLWALLRSPYRGRGKG